MRERRRLRGAVHHPGSQHAVPPGSVPIWPGVCLASGGFGQLCCEVAYSSGAVSEGVRDAIDKPITIAALAMARSQGGEGSSNLCSERVPRSWAVIPDVANRQRVVRSSIHQKT